jgi:hypothetical protein
MDQKMDGSKTVSQATWTRTAVASRKQGSGEGGGRPGAPDMSAKPLVVDNGTGFVKCGFAGDNFPAAIFPRFRSPAHQRGAPGLRRRSSRRRGTCVRPAPPAAARTLRVSANARGTESVRARASERASERACVRACVVRVAEPRRAPAAA